MTKEQFLAMSLPFNTVVCVKYTHKPDSSEYEYLVGLLDGRLITGETKEDDPLLPISDYHILLHPLSDLTKEIEHKGERFIPVLKLLEANCFDINENPLELIEKYKGIYFDIDLLSLSDALLLIEYHFDICGLIEKGEAIDLNRLNNNPYK